MYLIVMPVGVDEVQVGLAKHMIENLGGVHLYVICDQHFFQGVSAKTHRRGIVNMEIFRSPHSTSVFPLIQQFSSCLVQPFMSSCFRGGVVPIAACRLCCLGFIFSSLDP